MEVDSLKMYFPVLKGFLKRKVADVKAVDGVSFVVKKGETLGLVGETGWRQNYRGSLYPTIISANGRQDYF